MGKAARAIVINNNKILVMRRNKQGSNYYTLVGGRINDSEDAKQAVVREVKEETGLDILNAKLMFTEKHHEPYNDQYIFICEVSSYGSVAIQETSEEAVLNKAGINIHEPLWVDATILRLPFLTRPLQLAIEKAWRKVFRTIL